MPTYADAVTLPQPGTRVALSPAFNPPILKGIKVHADNPFRFEFILDQGDNGVIASIAKQSLKEQSEKLVKYFLASLTTPEQDLWVNLSPYEKNRIVPDSFGKTEMGRDLLAQDYMLKQITASLIYPEDEIGKKFWKRVYEESAKKFGNTNIPINTFNKVWIVPEKAVVYENTKAGTAYVVESKLKVMLEEDYLAMDKNVCRGGSCVRPQTTISIGSQITREIVIPALTKEINEGRNFSQLRQVYNSLILATWYKKKVKESILNQVYTDKNKTSSLTPYPLTLNPQQIYQNYLQAFKKGAYNYIKDTDMPNGISGPRKYFAGGVVAKNMAMIVQYKNNINSAQLSNDGALKLDVNMRLPETAKAVGANGAMTITSIENAYEQTYARLENNMEFPGVKGVPNFTKSGYFSPSNIRDVADILIFAGVTKQTKFIDAGGGDGRVAVVASSIFGAHAVSIEENRALFNLAREMVDTTGTTNSVVLVHGLIQDYDFSSADVVYYTYNEPYDLETFDEEFELGNESNFRKFEQQMAQQLKPGTVVVLTFGPEDLKFDSKYFEEFIPDHLSINMSTHPRFFRRNPAMSSFNILKKLLIELRSRNADIVGIGELSREPVFHQNIGSFDWYVYRTGKNNYLEIFVLEDTVIAYGLPIRRFLSSGKSFARR